ncbi:DUF11 domain-containing protein [Roseinatronobacter monicus]|uniref:Putative repeat protein (TIGR01451 family) n=1 Tax=Roseinatronobacter monicus TaxID=393481 RepID=A0A543K4G6_9RHOB|nr:DUF11 domain-containing protein [Roseinatronobacter monicus]TQM89981.1 putative repeat protein (TIGR01451 family) [Roseinatronobacter monicus]
MIPNPFRTLALSTALAVFAGGAMAQTAPNTVVTNTIDLTYNSGANTDAVTQNDAASVTFNVDRKVDVVVAALTGSGVFNAVPGQEVTLSYRVQNEGNDTQGFVIGVVDGGNIGVAGGLTYSETATTTEGEYYVMISTDGTVAGGTVYNVTDGLSAGDLNAGEEYYVLIIANVPIGATDGQLDDFIVTATATTAVGNTPVVEDRSQGLTGVNTVFVDAASDSTRTSSEIDPATNGKAADETRILITAPVIVAEKTVVVLDENLPGSTFDCAAGGTATGSPLAAIPGACLEYTIEIRNDSTENGGTAAGTLEITDVIPANTTYAGHTPNDFTITENGTPVTSIIAELATLAAGETKSFTIRVTID